jgi:hypothetical protein
MAASTIIIEELSGRTRRTILLSGSALPLQGATWPEEVVQSTTWYPGNRRATQQVLTRKMNESSFDFEWRTVRLARSPVRISGDGGSSLIERANTLVELFRTILGRSVRVTWVAESGGGTNSRVSRLGLMTKMEPAYERPDDIKVAVTFEWSGDGATSRSPVSTLRDDGDLSARVAAVKSSDALAKAILEQRMRSRISTIPLSADRFTLGQLEQLAKAPSKVVNDVARLAYSVSNRVRKIGDLIQTVRSTPAEIAGSILDVATDTIGSANGFVDRLTREPPETWSARVKMSSMLRAASYYNGAVTQSQLMARTYSQLAEQARKRRSGLIPGPNGNMIRRGDAYQTHLPKTGETFAMLALKYYGNADLAPTIAKANGLPGYTVQVPRLPIIIPALNAAQDSRKV